MFRWKILYAPKHSKFGCSKKTLWYNYLDVKPLYQDVLLTSQNIYKKLINKCFTLNNIKINQKTIRRQS